LRNSLQILAQDHPEAHILPFSAKTGSGRPELWQEIRQAVEQVVTAMEASDLEARFFFADG